MILFLFLAITEVLTFVVLYQHFFERSGIRYLISVIFNIILSIFLWILLIKAASYKGIYDTAAHIDSMLNFAGAVCAIVLPRIILIICHFTGTLIKRKKREHVIALTNAGIALSLLLLSVITAGTIYGRFNFRTEEVTLKVKGLNNELEGFKIIQISDLHLSCFYRHTGMLQKVMEKISAMDPDMIINTGDFVSFGWREFDGFDTILVKAGSRYGNFAVLGNHDTGTYNPDFTESEKENNTVRMKQLVIASGYHVLKDTNTCVMIGNAKVSLAGVTTYGRYPEITFGKVSTAMKGLEPSDYSILVCHDPNQWEEEVRGKADIDLTLAGHTHGMQIGILTKKFRWSPASFFYPRWNGLYSSEDQMLYVNRGMGVLAFPFRIWMPPEITVITLATGS